jgi:hypothetical protein
MTVNLDLYFNSLLSVGCFQEKAVPKSKYEEDVFINNHTSVWGSWWKDHHGVTSVVNR